MNISNGSLDDSVKEELAKFLGISPEDINDDDSLKDDLHLKPQEITDFLENLGGKGFDTTKVKFEDINLFSELVESLDYE